MKIDIRINNRLFTFDDIHLINQLISTEGEKGRTYLSKRLCNIWDWKTSKGIKRDIACRRLLRKLDNLGLIELPPPLNSSRKPGYKNKTEVPEDLNRSHLECSLSDFSVIDIQLVRGTAKEKTYNGLIDAFHYLGYQQQAGEQLKYLIYGDDRILSCLGFGAAALKVQDRDRFIGWTDEERKHNLQKIVNNNRFLILPWVKILNLASYILGKISRHIRIDWDIYYGNPIVMLETFVEKGRFRGISYRASNWIRVGQTKGRGRYEQTHKQVLAIKDVFVYPLVRKFREALIR